MGGGGIKIKVKLPLHFVWPRKGPLLYSGINKKHMIKNIKDFPRLDLIQQYENGKEIIRLCNEGIQEMEDNLECLRLELNTTPFEHEQMEIVENIVICNVHLSICEASKLKVEDALKLIVPIYN